MKSRAFTLIELLIGIVIFSIIVISIYNVFSVGILSWSKIDSRLCQEESVITLFNIFGKEIRNAINYKKNSFEGRSNNLTFYSIKNILDNDVELNYISQINYFIENGYLKKKEEALKVNAKLTSELLFKVKEVKFSYFNGKKWQDIYKDKDMLPLAVSIELVTDKDTYRKIIILPISPYNINI